VEEFQRHIFFFYLTNKFFLSLSLKEFTPMESSGRRIVSTDWSIGVSLGLCGDSLLKGRVCNEWRLRLCGKMWLRLCGDTWLRLRLSIYRLLWLSVVLLRLYIDDTRVWLLKILVLRDSDKLVRILVHTLLSLG